MEQRLEIKQYLFKNLLGCSLQTGPLIETEKTHGVASAVKILEAASTPKSISDISSECKISLSQTYRMVKELCSHNLLRPTSCSLRNGKKCFLYKSRLAQRKILEGTTWC